MRAIRAHTQGSATTSGGAVDRHVLKICSEASTNAALLRRRVDTDEDQIGLLDALVHVCGEEEVASAGLFDDVNETRLVDGEVIVGAVPRVDTRLVEIDDGDLDVGAFESDDGARRATWRKKTRVRIGTGSHAGFPRTDISGADCPARSAGQFRAHTVAKWGLRTAADFGDLYGGHGG